MHQEQHNFYPTLLEGELKTVGIEECLRLIDRTNPDPKQQSLTFTRLTNTSSFVGTFSGASYPPIISIYKGLLFLGDHWIEICIV